MTDPTDADRAKAREITRKCLNLGLFSVTERSERNPAEAYLLRDEVDDAIADALAESRAACELNATAFKRADERCREAERERDEAIARAEHAERELKRGRVVGVPIEGDVPRLLYEAVNDGWKREKARAESAEAECEKLRAVAAAADNLQRNCRIGECRPNCDECDNARIDFDRALADLPHCEAGRIEYGGECDCKPPESLADDLPRDIVEVLDAAVPGKHVAVFEGDPRRTGVADRWSWHCRCGTGSASNAMTLPDAQRDFGSHAALERQP